MQGSSFDRATTDRFEAIPGSRVLHLWHNRHELTWIKVEGDRGLGSP
jgi:23S rRNA (cytidine2498-2'-O)-methyltransferase